MAVARTNVFIFLLVCVIMCEAKRGPQEVEETRKHDPAWCTAQAGEGSVTRVEDMEERADNCCAAEQDAQCGGDYELEVSGEACSKQGAQLTLYEFKCYPDQSEFPLAVVISIVAVVAICCAIASACRFTYIKFQSPTLPEEQALFSQSERKSLTLSGSTSGALRQFGSRTSDTTKRQSVSSSTSEQDGAPENLPTVMTSKAPVAMKGQTVGKPQPFTSVQPLDLMGNTSSEPDGDSDIHI